MKANMLDYLESTVERVPERVAFYDDQESLTFAALRESAKRIGTCLAAVASPRTPVALLLDSRSIRQLIERERRQGSPILSDNRSGYFLAGSPEEVERFSRSMEHRAREILRTAAAVRAASRLRKET